METGNGNVIKRDIVKYLQYLDNDSDQIPAQKRSRLNDLILYINSKLKSNNWVRIVFVSPSDNSLSQLGQIWAKTMSVYNKLKGLETYSAGKNKKKINPMALEAISSYGFEIKKAKNGDQPVYSVKYADNMPAIKLFSKPLNHPENPNTGFAALVINQNEFEMDSLQGADFRMPLNYEIRPGENDEEKYVRICRQIGADMVFIFSNLDKAG